jgi:hypothetical protein
MALQDNLLTSAVWSFSATVFVLIIPLIAWRLYVEDWNSIGRRLRNVTNQVKLISKGKQTDSESTDAMGGIEKVPSSGHTTQSETVTKKARPRFPWLTRRLHDVASDKGKSDHQVEH